MAKPNTKGCHLVAAFSVEDDSCRRRYVLRSDGTILSGAVYPLRSLSHRDINIIVTTWPSMSLCIAWEPGTLADPYAKMLELVDHATSSGARFYSREGI